jgi:hypothetical protein
VSGSTPGGQEGEQTGCQRRYMAAGAGGRPGSSRMHTMPLPVPHPDLNGVRSEIAE